MAKLQLDIDDHPWELVALAALAGVWLATHAKRGGKPPGFLMGLAGGLALKLVRGGVIRGMTRLARSLISDAVPPASSPESPYASLH